MKFNFLNGSGGEHSSKRLFSFMIFIMWGIYFFANLFWGKELKATLEDNLFYLCLFTYAGVATEKVINNVSKKMTDPKEKQPDTIVITEKVDNVN
jgi:hypothetical protein